MMNSHVNSQIKSVSPYSGRRGEYPKKSETKKDRSTREAQGQNQSKCR